MKIFNLIILSLFIILSALYAQDEDLDKLMVRKHLTWEDVMLNCSDLIPKYYDHARYDSVEIIADYWERKCGLNEPLQRFKILYAINRGFFSEDVYDENIWQYLFTYRDEIKLAENSQASFEYFFHFYKNTREYVTTEFNDFTIKLALENIMTSKPGSLEYLFSKFYSADFDDIVNEISTQGKYLNTDLKRFYNDQLNYALHTTEGHLAAISGLWVPIGANKVLGMHPLIGFTIGAKSNRIQYDLSFIFRFLNTTKSYVVKHKGDLVDTNHFLGGYIGCDIGYEIYRSMHNEFDLIGGMGYDGFDAISSDSNDPDDSKSIGTFNMNLGLGYRYYPEEYSDTYIGLQARLNFVDYDNKAGTNLSGNTISLRVMYGWAGNANKNQQLKNLKYRY